MKLLASYLTDRTQYVRTNEKILPHKTASFPQEAKLGLILFNISLSDVKEICDDCICVKYADDPNIYKHCKTTTIEQNVVKLAKTLDEVYKLSESNNLIFNPDKTKFMTFTTNKSKIRNTDFEFHPENATTLTRTTSTKTLGVQFQQQLSCRRRPRQLFLH